MQAATFIPLAVVGLLVGFWLWMFNDMINNDEIPPTDPAGLRWPPVAKNQWIVCFVVLNIFAAGYYYFTTYRERR